MRNWHWRPPLNVSMHDNAALVTKHNFGQVHPINLDALHTPIHSLDLCYFCISWHVTGAKCIYNTVKPKLCPSNIPACGRKTILRSNLALLSLFFSAVQQISNTKWWYIHSQTSLKCSLHRRLNQYWRPRSSQMSERTLEFRHGLNVPTFHSGGFPVISDL